MILRSMPFLASSGCTTLRISACGTGDGHLASTFGSWKAAQKLSELRTLAQREQLMEAAGIAAFPSSQLVVQETIKRRNHGA